MDRDVIRGLIGELVARDGMLLVIDSGGAVAEMHTPPVISAEFDDRWATIEAGEWHSPPGLGGGGGGAVRGELASWA